MLSRQPYSWPLTGGITSKQSPLISDPSSYTTLNNVRMERLNEWRARGGYTAAVADTMPFSNPAVKSLGLPGGAAWAMCAEPANLSAGRVYSPSLSAARWSPTNTTQCSQTTPVAWTRSPLSGGIETPTSTAPDTVTMAAGGGYVLSAWTHAAIGTFASVASDVDGGAQGDATALGGGEWVRCVYAAVAGKLCAFIKDPTTGAISMYAWVAGVLTDFGVPVLGASDPAGPMDVAYYGGSTVTIVVRTAAGNQVKYIEFDPSTFTAAVNVNLAVTIDGSNFALSLFSATSGGNRWFVVANSTPQTRVVSITSSGTIQSNDIAVAASCQVATGLPNTSLAAFDWQIVYETGGTIAAVKKRNGVIGTASNLATAPAAGTTYRLHSNAWLTPTQTADCMRFIYGIHSTDQNTYYEHALVFTSASAAIDNRFPEPQARLAALNASPKGAFAGLSQIVTSGGAASLALARLTNFSLTGEFPGVQKQRFAVDRWKATYLDNTQANLLSANLGPGAVSGATAFMPCGTLLHTNKGAVIAGHGAAMLPTTPTLTAGGAGSLTINSTYGVVVTVDMYDDAGNIWHGPPSIAQAIALAGAGQTSITVAFSLTTLENSDRKRTVKVWTTKANGSTYQLAHSVTGTIANTATISYNHIIADTALVGADFLPLDLPSMLTPAVNHVAYFNGRMWASDREQPGLLWFTKPIQVGELPHFVFEFSVNIDAGTGPCTGLAAMDDKLIVFKKAAIYIVAGDGPDNNGGGQFPSVFRLDSDVGNLPGSPTPTTGSEVFFVAARGIHRINRSLAIDFVGMDVDQFLNQPLVGITDTVVAAVFVPSVNEVRFECTSQRLVYDRLHNFWVRDTGNSAGSLGVSATQSLVLSTGKHAILMSNATMYVEGGPLTADDGGVPYICTIRSAWMRPAGVDGYMRLYKARLLGVRTSPGGFPPSDAITPSLTIFYDNDDSLFETKFPQAALAGSAPTVRALAIPRRQKCSTFSLQVTIPTVGASGVDSVADLTFRLEQWAVEIGLKPGMQRNGTAERWT